MMPFPKRQEKVFFFSEYAKNIDTQRTTHGLADEAQQEDLVMAMMTPIDSSMADPNFTNAFLTLDEPEEPDGEDPDQLGHDGNIASIYLKEMNKVPLLTREREIRLAKAIQETERKIRNLILKCPRASEEMQRLQQRPRRNRMESGSTGSIVPRVIRKLLREAQSGGEDADRLRNLAAELKETETRVKAAKAEMIQSNLRLVVSIAKVYLNRGLSFLDLIQEGNMGLMKAVTRYDYRKGFKFSTYASWWIRQAITRALADKSRTIRIPNHLLETRSKTTKVFHNLMKELGREPRPEEIAEEANISLNNVLKVMYLIQEPVSLETRVGEDGSMLQDLVGSEESQSFNDDLIETMDVEKRTRDLLSLLSPREEQILRLRYGIGLPSGYTLEEIGKRFGISRERVRQIEERALRKLKYPARSEPDKAEAG